GLWTGDAKERARTVAWFGGFGGFTAADLVRGAYIGPDEVQGVIDGLRQEGGLVEMTVGAGRQLLLHADMVKELEERVLQVLGRLHEEHPLMTAHDRQKVQSHLDYV